MKQLFLPLALSLATTTAQAACPAPLDQSARLQSLIDAVKIAPDETTAQLISNEMWDIWDDAPDEKAQQMLDDGLIRRSNRDYEGALKAFDVLIEYCPNYAEGHNQRAFILFIQQDYPPALSALERAIELSPQHIAAIAGKALTLIALQRDEDAQRVLREALALNPWLKERRFLSEAPEAPQTDL
jgi:tetratricopeptide (TPR) repeat protein